MTQPHGWLSHITWDTMTAHSQLFQQRQQSTELSEKTWFSRPPSCIFIYEYAISEYMYMYMYMYMIITLIWIYVITHITDPGVVHARQFLLKQRSITIINRRWENERGRRADRKEEWERERVRERHWRRKECATHTRIRNYIEWAIQRPRTRSAAARQVSNAHKRDLVTNKNV